MSASPARLAAHRWPLAASHPVWLCAFRSLFGLAAISAWLLMLTWGGFLFLGWPLPAVPGGPFVWHAHELLLGFATAAAAGFALTGVPEFTKTKPFGAQPVRALVVIWLLARLAFWSSGWWPQIGLVATGFAQLAFLLLLAALLAPRLWRDPERRHLSFLWAVLALAATAVGFYVDALRGVPPDRWLHAVLGVMMALIVLALSRVSTSMVNESIDLLNAREHAEEERAPYLARPPRRNLALLAIAVFTLAQWWQPTGRVSAWLALAAACAVFNLLNDWHVGKPLMRRWPLMLYLVYVLMGSGYALIGIALLGGGFSMNAGLHLMTTGALGLNIYVVICIAGYTHSGLDKDGRAWVPMGAGALMLAAVLRAAAYGWAPSILMPAAALLWFAAFALLSWHMLPVFWSARADGAAGCAEWVRAVNPA